MLGYNDGELWYTHDGGVTFTQRVIPTPATAATVDTINDMDYFTHYHGILSVSWTGAGSTDRGSYMLTHNGGWTLTFAASHAILYGTDGNPFSFDRLEYLESGVDKGRNQKSLYFFL